MLLPWQSGLPPEMIPVRGAEEDTFAELGTINAGSVFLEHLQKTGKIKVVLGQVEAFAKDGLQTLPGQAIPAETWSTLRLALTSKTQYQLMFRA
ncbi:hypothetical protein WJX77_008345 [Trebouxia sp. C0004]